MIRPLPLAVLGAAVLFAGAVRADGSGAEDWRPGSGWLGVAPRPSWEAERGPAGELPPLGDAATTQLDRLHDNLFRALERPVERVDELFAVKGRHLDPGRNSSMRLRQSFEVREIEGLSPTHWDTDLDVNVRLRRLKDRFHLFLHDITPDALPGPSRAGEEGAARSWFLGARKGLLESRHVDFDAKTGVKIHIPPVAFAEVTARWRVPQPAGWSVAPEQSVYWLSSDGLGTKASVPMERWLRPGLAFLHLPSARISELSEGLEWQEVLLLGRVFRRTGREWEKSVAIQGSVSGHLRGAGVLDRYRLELPVRLPLHRRWVYGTLTPWQQWRDAGSWRGEYGLTLGLEALFQGTPER